MKALGVAVVLSLASVCQSASLACDKLLKPVDKGPDLSGHWYLIAMSSEMCLVTAFLNSLLLSVEADIASKGIPNIYDANFKMKIYGYCTTETEPFFYVNNNMFSVDRNNTPTGDPDVLLQSGCPDCIVVKEDGPIANIMLFSRRKTVTAAELTEFETQTRCHGWYRPQVLHSDHDYENCTSLDDANADFDTSAVSSQIYQRLKTSYAEPLKCLVESFLSYPRAAFESLKQLW